MDNAEVKRLGARWDPIGRRWYMMPTHDISVFARWMLPNGAGTTPPAITPSSRTALSLELVPRPAWYVNVRTQVPTQWDRIRKAVYRAAGWRCEICNARGVRMNCHEVWRFDDRRGIQILERLASLCDDCHRCKHWGLAQVRGQEHLAYAHLQRLNGISHQQAETQVAVAFAQWRDRNMITDWLLDTVALCVYDVEIPVPDLVPYVFPPGYLTAAVFDLSQGETARPHRWLDRLLDRLDLSIDRDVARQSVIDHGIQRRYRLGDS